VIRPVIAKLAREGTCRGARRVVPGHQTRPRPRIGRRPPTAAAAAARPEIVVARRRPTNRRFRFTHTPPMLRPRLPLVGGLGCTEPLHSSPISARLGSAVCGYTRSSAVAERPRDASWRWARCVSAGRDELAWTRPIFALVINDAKPRLSLLPSHRASPHFGR